MCILFIELFCNISYNHFSYYRASQGPRNKSRNEISKDINWPCTIVAALERTSKALSTADISSFLRSFCPFDFLLFSFPPPPSPLLSSPRVPPSHEVRAHPQSGSWILNLPLPRRRFCGKDMSSLSRLRFHVAKSGALYRDKSRTLTVWAFLAAEGGANKVKRGLKNVTLSVECGPLTVSTSPSRGRTPPSPRHSSRGTSSRATYLAMGSTRSRLYSTLTPIDNRFN